MKKAKNKTFVYYLSIKEKRAIAFFVDGFVTALIPFVPALSLYIIKNFIEPRTELLFGLIILLSMLLALIYLCVRDIIRGQSIGKRVTKIMVADSTGKTASIAQIILYDITALIYPIEALLLLIFGKTLGEKLSDTIIKEVK